MLGPLLGTARDNHRVHGVDAGGHDANYDFAFAGFGSGNSLTSPGLPNSIDCKSAHGWGSSFC